MLKLKKRIFNNETFRRFSTSAAVSIADPTTITITTPTPIYSDPRFYISSLINSKNNSHVTQIHTLAIINGVLHDICIANKLIYMYCQFNFLNHAHSVFDEMPVRDNVSWSLMVGGYAKAGDYLRCFHVFNKLIASGIQPDNFTLPFVVRLCRDRKDLVTGRLLHGIVLKFGLHLDSFVCAAIVDMYAKCGEVEDARYMFDKLSNRDVVAWTVMIGACTESGNASEALAMFDRMREEGVVPDKINMVAVVNACANFGSMHKAKTVHEYICRQRFSFDVILGSAMIDMYAKCGDTEAAREIFDTMKVRNVISWTAMIAAYGYYGQGSKALDLFHMMLSNGILPNKITFLSLLYACSHSGLVEEGNQIFSSMWEDYGMKPGVKHYTCMVDLLGRAGKFDEAIKLIESMSIEKDEGIYGALLGACRLHKNIDLAEKVADSLQLQPKNPAHYILISNIYASASRWADVANIRYLMSQRKLKKVPGYTWIEINDKTYQFSVADRTHPHSKEIYKKLKDLGVELELAGYIPDTNCVLHDVNEEAKKGMLCFHSEKLAIAFGLIATEGESIIRITKNLRVCSDCHTFIKYVSAVTQRVIIVRDANRFHHFEEGKCSCKDYW
ncbi:hypothetical protein ACFE04_020125 [Oxalis oulophora]